MFSGVSYRVLVCTLVLASVCQASSGSSGHRCIHDELDHAPEIVPDTSLLEIEALVNKPWEPLRIHFDTSFLDNDPTKRSCKRRGAKVGVGQPADSTVQCTNEVKDDCWRTCETGDVLTRGKKNKIKKYISKVKKHFESYLKVKRRPLDIQADTCKDITIPSSLKTAVKTTADLVIMVTARTVASHSTGAYAAACELATGDNRPILGYVNFNVAAFDSKPDNEMEILTIHEVTHVLGFSNGLYKYYMGPGGTSPRKLETTVRQINSHQAITTPRVVQWLREHLNCASVCGAPLEDHGGQGTAGSHWELAVFYGSYMCGVQLPEFQTTDLTGALFEDTGWYKVNHEVTTEMTFGRNAGCDFVKGCSGYPENYKCRRDKTVCSYDGRGASYCNLPFDIYFKVGCYFPRPLAFDKCSSSTPRRLRQTARRAKAQYGSSSSRCFSGTVQEKKHGPAASYSPLCYNYECDHAHAQPLKVVIGANKYHCPKDGGELPAFDPAHGLVGKLYCPPAVELCPPAKKTCDASCQSVDGACIDGKCYCPPNEAGHGDSCIRCPKCDAPPPTPTPRIPAPRPSEGQCVSVYKAKPVDPQATPVGPCTIKNFCNHKVAVRVNCRHGKQQTLTVSARESRVLRCDSIAPEQDDLLLELQQADAESAMDSRSGGDEWITPGGVHSRSHSLDQYDDDADLMDDQAALSTKSKWWGKKKKKKKATTTRRPRPRPRGPRYPACPANPRRGGGSSEEDGCYCNYCTKVREIRCA